MKRLIRPMVLSLGVVGWSVGGWAADWPQFRGPNLDQISTETDWSAEALLPKPNILWKTDIGIGYSAPAVVGDAVYVSGYTDGKEHIRRLSAKTGEVVWTHSYEGEKVDNLNAGGPCATPTVVGDVVYTNGRAGQVCCLRADSGEVVWEADLLELGDIKLPEWGFASSPLLVEGKLILDAGRLVALDPKTGETIWKADKEYKPGYGTPTPFEWRGKSYLAHLNNDGLTIVTLADGKEVAFREVEAQFETAATSPIVREDLVWISVGYDGICALLKFTGEGLEEIYENKDLRNHFDTSILRDGFLYGVNGQSNRGRTCTIVCMDFKTGEVAWEERGMGFGSMTAAGDSLIFLSDVGKLTIFPIDPQKFEATAEAEVLEGQCWTAPVLAGGTVYCRSSEGTLVAVSLRK